MATHTRIWVKDEGQGFSAEDKEKIFSSFQRLSAQPIEVGNSYGLGLSIIKKLSEIVGATINLEDSEKGACFLWELPTNPLLHNLSNNQFFATLNL